LPSSGVQFLPHGIDQYEPRTSGLRVLSRLVQCSEGGIAENHRPILIISRVGLIMTDDEVIGRMTEFSRDRLSALLAESEASGYRFVRRLVDEWERGVNRFSRPGEALLAAESGGRVLGVCGLNVDPYLDDPRVGRVRNVYVLAACRGRGIGRRLVGRAISEARGHFDRLRLRGEEAGPARLYESLGFRPCAGMPDCTHILELAG
jgi:GNAT superfamily N-acetyltransferase